MADYIHLNPARARLAGGKAGKLTDYRWSSLSCFAKGRGPTWLVTERVLRSFELAESGRGRRAYVDWLEARAAHDGGKIDRRAQEALRRGWYLGEESFRDRLLDLVDQAKGVKKGKRRKSEGADRDHGQRDAERIIEACGPVLELPEAAADLAQLRKGDARKAVLAAILRAQTTVGFDWIAKRLAMGHPGSVSRLVSQMKRDRKWKERANEMEKMFHCGDSYDAPAPPKGVLT